MRNIRLTLAYEGTAYVGWQIQPNGRSVQAVLEQAIQRLTNEPVKVIAAGRTDSGVHALGQVANFHTSRSIPCTKLRSGLQTFLPDDVVVLEAREVDPKFHATYSAKWKRYRYVIFNGSVLPPFLRNFVWQHHARLDVSAMHAAAQVLLGKHDFRCFESQFPNKATSVRTIQEISVDRYAGWPVWTQTGSLHRSDGGGRDFIWLDVVADGFLYNMVRAIVGTLVKVGRGLWTADDVRRILENQDRGQAGETAPARGLYLVHVAYEDAPVA
jgi:tRNA pseudouridine38-40 synthase